MSHVSYPFKKPNKAIYKKPTTFLTDDNIYWKKLGLPVLVKEFGAIDYLDFSPVKPYYFAATCSVRIQIYDPITKVVSKNISKFVEAAYGGSFREDGKLLVAGSEEAAVKLFDVHSKNLLRVFTGHTGPVHRTFFSKDQLKVLSFSDDKSVGVWDIATEEMITSFTDHTDYVRAGAASPISPDMVLSGGYDHAIKLYDCRSNETVLTVNHGTPVESVLFLPSGGIFISAGGTEIKLWDIFNGGKLLANISQHHKTVTTLRLASNNSRLMSASLDRHVKIYDMSTFKVVHNIDFPNAILSMAISEDDDVLAVGMVDGVISVRSREQLENHSNQKRGLFKFVPDNIIINKTTSVTTKKQREVDEQHDVLLRKTEYTRSLASVLRPPITTKFPEKTAAIIQELLRRKVLHSAMDGLDKTKIGALLRYFKQYLGVAQFTRTIIDATNVFIDVFEDQASFFSEDNLHLYNALKIEIVKEIEVCKRISELEGAIGLLLSGALVTTGNNTLEFNELLVPSSRAKGDFVIDV